MELTKEEAKEFAIKKWQWIVDNNGMYDEEKIIIDIPELNNFKNECSYCELYLSDYINCQGCPLIITSEEKMDNEQIGCWQNRHPFKIWVKNETQKNAQKVLDLIIRK